MPSAGELQQMQFGGGVSASVFSPVVLIAIVLAGILVLILPRHNAIIPFLAAALLVPTDQILVIGQLHFPMLRVLLVFGFVRMLMGKLGGKGEILTGGVSGLDMVVIALSAFTALDGVLLWKETGVVVYQLGVMYTSLGTYFLLRYLIRDEEDLKRTIRVWACVAVVIAGIMIGEELTRKNVLYMAIGGARATFAAVVDVRDGSVRARGPFQHPILAGTFGGFSLPLFLELWWRGKADRKFGVLGSIASVVTTLAASSSTALMGGLGGILGLCFWPLRRKMRLVRWGIVGVLAAGHLYMKSPVWHLIFDIDFTGSSSSYHRYMLVDECIRHFWEWVLVGTKNWGTWGWMMWDLSNQYVATADTAGLIPLISFLAILVFGFKYLGRARRTVEGDRRLELFIWAMGASLFGHLVAFFGITYFDQTSVCWYALLAMISAATLSARRAEMANESPTEAQPHFELHPALQSGSVELLK